MFDQAIDKKTKRVFEKIAQTPIAKNFYLAGGTALALQLGHRKSIDLDWFCQNDFSNAEIKNQLASIGHLDIRSEDEGTIHGQLDGINITFLRYRYDQLFPFVVFNHANLSDERDISAMKIDAMSTRGSKKDFIDIYFLLEKYLLADLIGFFKKKFKKISYNKLHILKSLAYFEDAENDPMPIMLKENDWKKVKEKIVRETAKYLDSL
ncbi:MAG: nucleotidyl transferase AbiEii/AbiGii toxin family protein [Parcubacteria group bacterium]|jgi:hypothetical protein